MKVQKFEDLDIWIRSRGLVKDTYKITLKEKFSKDWQLGTSDRFFNCELILMG